MTFFRSILLLLLLALPNFAQVQTVVELLRNPVKGQSAVLEGHFVGKANASTYLLQDATGTLRVDVDTEQEIPREAKKGALIRIEGILFRPFGKTGWELQLEELTLLGKAPDYSKAVVRSVPAAGRVPIQGAVPRPSGRKPLAPISSATPAKNTLRQILRAAPRDRVEIVGTILELPTNKSIVLWDGSAAVLVRLDGLAAVPELARAQRITVRGSLVRDGAFVQLVADRVISNPKP